MALRTIWEGIEVGDRDAAGEVAGISGTTFAAYVRGRRPKNNPPPDPVTRDLATGRFLWDLEQVHEWSVRRPGSGWWRSG